MAFDLSTAKPVSGFDLSTARPVGEKTEEESPPTIGEKIIGGLETAGTFVSSLSAEPVAGLAGLYELASDPLNPMAGVKAGQRVRDVRESLTYKPKTKSGIETGRAVGEALAPVGEAIESGQRYLGDKAMDATGNPALAAAAYSAPMALLTLAGYRGPKKTPTTQKPNLPNPIVEAGNKSGVPVLTSDVRPPQTFIGKQAQKTGERIPVVGTQGARAGQQAARETAALKFADKYSNFSYQEIVDSLKSRRDRIKQAAGNTLEKTGQTLDGTGPIQPQRTMTAIQSVKQQLEKPGVIQSSDALDNINTLLDALSEPQTFTTLKQNRTAFREMVDSVDVVGRSQLPSNAKRLLGEVERAMKSDMDDFARSGLSPKEYSQWQKANAIYANEARALTKTKLKRVLDSGEFTPESVQTMLFSKKPSEVQQLYSSLTPNGRANARAAIISKVVGDLNKRANGFSPTSFVNELKKYEIQTGTFFKGAEAKALEGLRRVLDATKRAQEAGVATPTGQDLYAILSILGIAADPVTALPLIGTAGGLARLYESAPARNALLRLASAPPKTPVFDDALLTASATLTAVAQSISSEQTKQQARPPQQ